MVMITNFSEIMRCHGIPDQGLKRIAQAMEEAPDLIFDFGGDVSGDQYNAWIAAYDGETKQGLGYIQYSMYEDTTQIMMVEVSEENQGRGVATALLEEVMRKEDLAYQDLEWGMLTDDGAALKEKTDVRFGR